MAPVGSSLLLTRVRLRYYGSCRSAVRDTARRAASLILDFTDSGRTSRSMDQPTAEQALRELEPLVGEWTLEARWPSGEQWPGGGRVTFEWHDSGAHLVERGTVELPEAPDNVSIIGCDGAHGAELPA